MRVRVTTVVRERSADGGFLLRWECERKDCPGGTIREVELKESPAVFAARLIADGSCPNTHELLVF